MRHIFTETEEIAKKNRRNGIKQEFTISKFSYKEKEILKPQKKQIKKYSHCKECGEKLTNWRAQMWGICAFCDDK